MNKETNKTKQKILTVAAKLFAKNGFSATSMNDIANAVNIEKSSLYYFFKNKNDIFSAVIENIWDKLIADIEKIIGKSTDNYNQANLNKIIETLIISGLKSGLTIIDINSHQLMKSCTCETIFKQIIAIKTLIINILKKAKVKQSELAQEIIMNAVHAYVIHAQHHKQVTKPATYAAYLTDLFI